VAEEIMMHANFKRELGKLFEWKCPYTNNFLGRE
jgi:hypothetical protein